MHAAPVAPGTHRLTGSAFASRLHRHSQCHSDGIEYEQLRSVLTQLLRATRNGYGELPHKQLETKLDMTREVAQTVLALLTELPRSAWRPPAWRPALFSY